jgi:hypothetical protein
MSKTLRYLCFNLPFSYVWEKIQFYQDDSLRIC